MELQVPQVHFSAAQKVDPVSHLFSGGMAPAVLAVAGTSTPATGCVGREASPSTWPASPATPASASCPPERNVVYWRTGSSAGHTTILCWRISNVLRKMVCICKLVMEHYTKLYTCIYRSRLGVKGLMFQNVKQSVPCFCLVLKSNLKQRTVWETRMRACLDLLRGPGPASLSTRSRYHLLLNVV